MLAREWRAQQGTYSIDERLLICALRYDTYEGNSRGSEPPDRGGEDERIFALLGDALFAGEELGNANGDELPAKIAS